MIKEIKRQRELLRFSEIIHDLKFYNGASCHTYYTRSTNTFIFAIHHQIHHFTIYRSDIIRNYGITLPNEDMIMCIGKLYNLNEIIQFDTL